MATVGDQQAAVSLAEYIIWEMAQAAIENEAFFGELDAVVGDGDFGYSLARGFEEVVAQWKDLGRERVGEFVRAVGMVIARRVGGTSGPIWGTAFLRAASVLGAREELSAETGIAMLDAVIDGIKARGGAAAGDKTLLDALIPATAAMTSGLERGQAVETALAEAATAAREGAEKTRGMVAKKGRAAYAGERSVGAIDPGAVAVATLFERVVGSWPGAGSSEREAEGE